MFSIVSEHIEVVFGHCQCLTVMFNNITADSGDSLYKQLLIMLEYDNIPNFNRAYNSDPKKYTVRLQGWFHRSGRHITDEEHAPKKNDYHNRYGKRDQYLA